MTVVIFHCKHQTLKQSTSKSSYICHLQIKIPRHVNKCNLLHIFVFETLHKLALRIYRKAQLTFLRKNLPYCFSSGQKYFLVHCQTIYESEIKVYIKILYYVIITEALLYHLWKNLLAKFECKYCDNRAMTYRNIKINSEYL